MPYSYDLTGKGVGGSNSVPLQIGRDVTDALWYLPRGVYHGSLSNNYTGQYAIWATPVSFSRPMTISEWRFPYSNGAAAVDFPVGADAVMFRAALYEADENGLPKTFAADLSWSYYDPNVDAQSGFLGAGCTPFTMLSNKKYFLVMVATAVSMVDGSPDTVLEDDSFLIRYNVGAQGPLDPLSSFGLTEGEMLYQPLGITGFYPDDVRNAILGAGNALAAFPGTLGDLWDTVFTVSNAMVVNLKGQPA